MAQLEQLRPHLTVCLPLEDLLCSSNVDALEQAVCEATHAVAFMLVPALVSNVPMNAILARPFYCPLHVIALQL